MKNRKKYILHIIQTFATANKPKRIFKHNLQHKKKSHTKNTCNLKSGYQKDMQNIKSTLTHLSIGL